MKLLLDAEVYIDLQNGRSRTAVYVAVLSNYMDIFNLLVDAGADVNIGDTDGRCPVHVAANANNLDMLRALFAAGADMNPECSFGLTPVFLAEANGFVECLVFLLSIIFDPIGVSVCL